MNFDTTRSFDYRRNESRPESVLVVTIHERGTKFQIGTEIGRTMNVRLKDIANELGVSVVTVSRALRGRPDISSETKNRILERVRELNYR